MSWNYADLFISVSTQGARCATYSTVELAERSKVLESGSSPKGRGFKSHTPHFASGSSGMFAVSLGSDETGA